jgi:hypothetical protein
MRKGVWSMRVKPAPWADELTKFYEAPLLDLPAAAARRAFAGDERGFSEAGWKAYDSWVRLANETANQLYANRTFGEAAGRVFETALGLRRLDDALVSAFLEPCGTRSVFRPQAVSRHCTMNRWRCARTIAHSPAAI